MSLELSYFFLIIIIIKQAVIKKAINKLILKDIN